MYEGWGLESDIFVQFGKIIAASAPGFLYVNSTKEGKAISDAGRDVGSA